nr:hypothetical protein [uncultured Sphingomonas sp.]
MDDELQKQTNAKREDRSEWIRPEVHRIDAGAAEAGAAAGGDFGSLS